MDDSPLTKLGDALGALMSLAFLLGVMIVGAVVLDAIAVVVFVGLLLVFFKERIGVWWRHRFLKN